MLIDWLNSTAVDSSGAPPALAVRVTDLALQRRARFTTPQTPHDGKVLA